MNGQQRELINLLHKQDAERFAQRVVDYVVQEITTTPFSGALRDKSLKSVREFAEAYFSTGAADVVLPLSDAGLSRMSLQIQN